MKEFDFVKLTLWVAMALTAGLGGGYVWLGTKLDRLQADILNVERIAKDIGARSRDIATLREERNKDKTRDKTQEGIHSYFAEQARQCKMDPNVDYTLKPKEPDLSKDKAYTDIQYVLDFKRDRPKLREQVMIFIYNVESQSRRMKLSKAKISLVEAKAQDDLWTPDMLTFVRRDPYTPKAK